MFYGENKCRDFDIVIVVLGFDRVDSLLFTYILGKLSIDKRDIFEFEESEFLPIFSKCVVSEVGFFTFKKGITLDANVSPIKDYEWPLKQALSVNKNLLQYLDQLDFKEIVKKKVEALGLDEIGQMDYLFSDKEKEIMDEILSRQGDKDAVKVNRLSKNIHYEIV